jgi:uncharacterized membrane protein YcaP (DUF421 family)
MGKRQVVQLEPNELVIMIMISELAAIPIQDKSLSLFQGIVPIIILVLLQIGLSLLLLKSIRARVIVCGKPSVLIKDGLILRKALAKSRIMIEEVLEELRIKGVTDVSTVQYGIIETNGQISVILYPQHQPVTQGQMSVSEENKGLPVIVLNDGRWLDSNLKARGLTREFVQNELSRRGIDDIKSVYVAMVDELNHVYVAGRQAR